MAKRPTRPIEIQSPPELLTSQQEAEDKINDRIEKGRDLLKSELRTSDQLKCAYDEYSKWSDFNKELLIRIFTNDSLSLEYSRSVNLGSMNLGFGRGPSLGDEIRDFNNTVNKKIHALESIKGRLELIPSSRNIQTSVTAKNMDSSSNKAFIVHGHDEGARESVARLLEKLGITPIILHELASGSRTVIEKLEQNSNVDFAIVLLTPDDVGAVGTAKDTLNPRARQNVILELGYFVGKLGRNRVCALHKGSVELPSDFGGVVYVALDTAGAWRLFLAKELREAGFNVDLNQAL